MLKRGVVSGGTTWDKKFYPTLPIDANVTGRGFNSELNSDVFETTDGIVLGRGFTQEVDIHGGIVVTGAGFSTNASSTVQANNEAFVSGRGFSSEPVITAQGIIDVTVAGRGFASEPGIYSGAIAAGRGFSSDLTSQVDTSEIVNITGRGFTQSVILTAKGNESANVTGRGFLSGLFYSSVTGRGFASQPVINIIYENVQDKAFIMNIHTTEVTQYTNYQFTHIIHIGNKPYGVKSDGLYLLEGLDDNGTQINGAITTKETDFGAYQSKNVNSIYLNSDTETSITSFVDGEEQHTYTSKFNGRKTKLGRGAKGRYWQFKIENISRLEGAEILPQPLQRRVK